MTLIDQVIGALTPVETEADRLEARNHARTLAHAQGWLSMILDHHQQIERAFADIRDARSMSGRTLAHERLSIVLAGHSIAEEAVVYPALARIGQKVDAAAAYLEQSTAKLEMAALEELDPSSGAYLEKLEEIREAVAHHVFEEESTWFLELQQKADASTQQRLTQRYQEEYERYATKGGRDAATPTNYGGNEIGMREGGGYSGSSPDQSQRGGLPLAGVEGGAYGGLHDDDVSDRPPRVDR